MKTNSTRNDDNTVTLTGTVDKDTWSKECKKALNSLSKRANFKGFRNGKVPAGMIRKMYGKGAIEDMAAEKLANASLEAMLEEANVEPIERITFSGYEEGEDGVVLTFIVPVAPEAKLGEWKNLGIEKETPEVTDEEVDDVIEELRSGYAEENLLEEGTIEDGDKVDVEFTADMNGEPDGKGTYKQTVVVGRSGMVPAFDEGLVGLKSGDTKDIETVYEAGTMGEDQTEDTTVVFHVTVGDVFRPEKPELNDEFAKTVKEFDYPETADELKTEIRERIQAQKDDKAEDEYIAAILSAVREKTELDIPQSMIDAEINSQLRQLEANMNRQGIKFDQFLAMTGMSLDQLKANYEDEAEARVFNTLILDAIARELNLDVTDEEVETEYENFAKENNLTVEQIKKAVDPKDLRHSLLDDKAMDALLAAQETETASAAE